MHGNLANNHRKRSSLEQPTGWLEGLGAWEEGRSKMPSQRQNDRRPKVDVSVRGVDRTHTVVDSDKFKE